MTTKIEWNKNHTVCIIEGILEVHPFDKHLYGNVLPRQAKNLLMRGYREDRYLTRFNMTEVFTSTLKTTIYLPFGYSIMIFKLELSSEWRWSRAMKYVTGE